MVRSSTINFTLLPSSPNGQGKKGRNPHIAKAFGWREVKPFCMGGEENAKQLRTKMLVYPEWRSVKGTDR